MTDDRMTDAATANGLMHVVIAGAGVAGLEAALALRDLAGDRVRVEVVAPQDDLLYWPLLVTQPFGAPGSETVPLAPLFDRLGIRFLRGALASVDTTAKAIRLGSGEELAFDALVIACGATHSEAVAGALTFPALGAVDELRQLLDDVAEGRARRIVFALPPGAGWPLPLYELALMAAAELERRHVPSAELLLVTPESDPLGLFGRQASDAVRTLLEQHGIELVPQTYPVAVTQAGLTIRPGGLLAADRVVALSRVDGPELDGVPRDANGFIPVDRHGAVVGLTHVYAAGDATAFPLKQGGIAADQAATVAEAIAAVAGAPVTPRPFRPILRGMLLTGGTPRYLRSELTGGYGTTSVASEEPLWWPPAKIAGRYLGPALAELTTLQPPAALIDVGQVVPIEIELSDRATEPTV
jgi:sulfide:quinone oxidoreductase